MRLSVDEVHSWSVAHRKSGSLHAERYCTSGQFSSHRRVMNQVTQYELRRRMMTTCASKYSRDVVSSQLHNAVRMTVTI